MAILAECPRCKTRQKTANKRCKCGENLDSAKRSNRVCYWITYRLPNGKQRTEPVKDEDGSHSTSIELARDALGKRMGQRREGRIFDMLPDSKKTFADLAKWFIGTAKISNLASRANVVRHLAIFNETFGKRRVSTLTRDELLAFKFAERKNKRADSYIDQIVDSARWMVTDALEEEEIAGDCLKPFRKLKPFCPKGANARKRVLSLEEYQRLQDALLPHLKPVVACAWWTGMRLQEILDLTWDRVDLARRFIYLRATDTKEARSKVVPLAKPLRDMLMQLPGRGGEKRVFKYAGKGMMDITQGIETSCTDAGIVYGRFKPQGFIFHDLRHCFATYARKAGVPKNVIMAIMGHAIRDDMNARYDLVDESDLLAAVDRMAEVFPASVYQIVYQDGVKKI